VTTAMPLVVLELELELDLELDRSLKEKVTIKGIRSK